MCVPCHQECTFYHFCGRYYLAVPMQFTNAQSPGSSRRTQAVEAIGREIQAETLSLLGFNASAPLTQAIWQGKQTGRWDKGQDERLEKSTDRNEKAAGGGPKAQCNFRFFVSVVLFFVFFCFVFVSLTAKFVTCLSLYIAFVLWSQMLH